MRIDFSKLEQIEQSQRSSTSPLLNTLPLFWQKQPTHKLSIQAEVDQDVNSFSFSVSFPYEVNRKLSPSSIGKELSYLQTNRVLPQSTLRFIQNTLESDRQKSQSPKKKDSSRVIEPKKKDSIIRLETVVDSRVQDTSQKTDQNINKISTQISPKKQKGVLLNKMAQPKKKFSYKKKVCEGICKKLKNQSFLSREQSLKEVTFKPLLNYTMNSRAFKDISKKRKQHFTSCNSDVFQSLYNDAALYAKKREVEKVIFQEEAKMEQKKSSRITVTSTFEERYQRSLEKEAERQRKAQHKLRYNEETGRKYFVPDTTNSKMTYLTLFKSTASLSPFHMEKPRPVRSNYYSRESSKLNHSPEQITTTLNRSCELPSSFEHKYCANRRVVERDNELAQLYTNLLWTQEDVKQEELTRDEKNVLGRFLESVAQFQYGRSVSRQVFTALFKKHYNNLNLFDKAIINARLKSSRSQRKVAQQSIVSQQQSYLADGLEYHRRKRSSKLSHVSKFLFV